MLIYFNFVSFDLETNISLKSDENPRYWSSFKNAYTKKATYTKFVYLHPLMDTQKQIAFPHSILERRSALFAKISSR